jgi:hypothetical protein
LSFYLGAVLNQKCRSFLLIEQYKNKDFLGEFGTVRETALGNKVLAVSHENTKAICKNKTSFGKKTTYSLKQIKKTNAYLSQDLRTKGRSALYTNVINLYKSFSCDGDFERSHC